MQIKEDYERTIASDVKSLPALNMSIILVNILGLIYIIKSTKKIYENGYYNIFCNKKMNEFLKQTLIYILLIQQNIRNVFLF